MCLNHNGTVLKVISKKNIYQSIFNYHLFIIRKLWIAENLEKFKKQSQEEFKTQHGNKYKKYLRMMKKYKPEGISLE